MCGITGFIDHNKRSSLSLLQKITTRLEHRGPDDAGFHFINNTFAQVGLGHRRLSVIDLSEGGKQPMHFGALSIVFNGEIYNYKEISLELTKLGHTFNSHSDTEVVLHAYAEWGPDSLNKFTGMFAFVIYDANSETLFGARDRAGVKPFFYYYNSSLLLFASELKAFHEHPDFSRSLNRDAVAAFLQFGNVPGEHCIFENCHKLKPAHYFTYSLQDKKLKLHKYWDVYDAYNKPKWDISFNEAKNETEKVLQKACEYRMVSDVPVGIFLSGGYDSTAVTALLQKNQNKKINTFTISVPDMGLNEAPYASEIAKHLGTQHFEFNCTIKDAKQIIDQLPYYYDEPFADSSSIPSILLSRSAKAHVKVALSADAGDEVFAGYNRYDYLMKHGSFLNSVPAFMRRFTTHAMNRISAEKIPYFNSQYNFANRYEKLKSLLIDPSAQNMMLSLSKQYRNEELNEFFLHKIRFPQTAYQTEQLKKDYFSPLAYMMAIDYQTYLPDDILQKVDRASMSAGLEAREPFLDHHLIEWAARLPDAYKYHKGVKKYILKEIVHQYVPKKLMDRPKMGFAIPIEKWLKDDLKQQTDHYLNSEKIATQGIFHPEPIHRVLSNFYAGKSELALKVWYLLMFQMWYEKWME